MPLLPLPLLLSLLPSPVRGTTYRLPLQATVGAGLPVISTLQGLLETGDRVIKVEGILSGTLSYIFNNFGWVTSDVCVAGCMKYIASSRRTSHS